MVKYSCDRCGKGFSQKSHYDSHNRRKTPCENNADNIKALVDKAVEEKFKDLNNTKLIVEDSLNGELSVKNDLYGACFTIKIKSNMYIYCRMV